MLQKEYLKCISENTTPEYDPNKVPLYDVNQIKKMLPHRNPFLLLDKVIEKGADSVSYTHLTLPTKRIV